MTTLIWAGKPNTSRGGWTHTDLICQLNYRTIGLLADVQPDTPHWPFLVLLSPTVGNTYIKKTYSINDNSIGICFFVACIIYYYTHIQTHAYNTHVRNCAHAHRGTRAHIVRLWSTLRW